MRVLVIAPHADDELLGCGGTLLKHVHSKDEVNWLLLTCARAEHGYTLEEELREAAQIESVRAGVGFRGFVNLGLAPAALDQIPKRDLSASIGKVVRDCGAECLYLPHPGDAHSDHLMTFDAACSATKCFRYPHVQRVLTYETLSETEFGISPNSAAFRPSLFVDISDYLEKKLELLRFYTGQLGEFPFPRSEESLTALAKYRGSSAGFKAAESFMILKDTWR